MFLAALWSRCRLVHHSGQECQRTDKPLATILPQPEHFWLVNAGSTAITERPAHASLKLRMVKNILQPASWMLLARWCSGLRNQPASGPQRRQEHRTGRA